MGPSDRDRRVRRPGSWPFAAAWNRRARRRIDRRVREPRRRERPALRGRWIRTCASRPSRGDETTGGAGPDGSIEPDADLESGAGAIDATSFDAAGDACSATPVCNPDSTCRAGCSQTLTCNACGQWPGTCAPCSITYNDTGTAQTFEVPEGVTQVTIEAFGGQGCMGGLGGLTTATIMVTPAETLTIDVGAGGCDGTGANYNGGGLSDVLYQGPGGGGASDVRQGGTDLSNRIVVAGGGGGAGIVFGDAQSAGGAGGGTTGAPGAVPAGWGPAGGGTPTAGGVAGNCEDCTAPAEAPTSGTLGVGGTGSFCEPNSGAGGGAGGGGYYGGGGGSCRPRDGRWRRRRLIVRGPRGDQRDDDAGREHGERQGRHHVLTPQAPRDATGAPPRRNFSRPHRRRRLPHSRVFCPDGHPDASRVPHKSHRRTPGQS